MARLLGDEGRRWKEVVGVRENASVNNGTDYIGENVIGASAHDAYKNS